MSWRDAVNGALARAAGYRLERVHRPIPRVRPRPLQPGDDAGDRLLRRPVFVLCSIRSGSTLLRLILNSHSQIHAPHELHLRHIQVRLTTEYARRSVAEVGLDGQALQYLLWDRLLHRELATSGKPLLASKTPNNVFIADRIAECWPDARFVFLLRHPAAILRSRAKLRPKDPPGRNLHVVARYARAVEHARATYPGLTLRYEDLTADPDGVTRRLCDFLEVPWEAAMLHYGEHPHGPSGAGLGDWTGTIRSGRVQPAKRPPEAVPAELREIAASWGYVQSPAEAGRGSF